MYIALGKAIIEEEEENIKQQGKQLRKIHAPSSEKVAEAESDKG